MIRSIHLCRLEQIDREGLEQVAVDLECSMEDAEDVDRFGTLDHVSDAIMAVKQDADVPVWFLPVAVP